MTRHVPDDAVIAVDVGNNAYSFGRYFECTRQSVLMSGYLGSIGFGFPAAMGAWAAAPGPADRRGHRRRRLRPVPRRAHDRGEVRHGHHPRAARQRRSSARSPRSSGPPSTTCGRPALHNPDFAAYAELCGALGIRVDRRRPSSTTPSPTRSPTDGPALVEVITDPDLV